MSKSAKKAADQAEREKVHKRYSNRREPDVIYPAKKQVDFYDADIHQRVAVYVRVSTDNLGQETSYELQKNYYEEFVLKHPKASPRLRVHLYSQPVGRISSVCPIVNTRNLCRSISLTDTRFMESRIALYHPRHPWKMSHQSKPHINQRYLCRRGV